MNEFEISDGSDLPGLTLIKIGTFDKDPPNMNCILRNENHPIMLINFSSECFN